MGFAFTALLKILVAVVASVEADVVAGTYQELFYSQSLDHFNPQDSRRWDQRYLFSEDSWDGSGALVNGCKGPILLYTGNEGPVDAFWAANGFMVDYLAPKWGALLVFPEERFYGKSLPFGNASSASSARGSSSSSSAEEELRYLSTEQVLEDLAEVVTHLKGTLEGAEDCPVVAFGGSYGGTLTTFLRAAYPALVVGGLAASAPVGYYDPAQWGKHGVSEFTFSDIVTKDYADADPQCLAAIAAAKASVDEAPVDDCVDAFGVCDAQGLTSTVAQASASDHPTAQSDLFLYALESLPQMDYPYPVGGLPAWPVNASCAVLVAAFASGAGSASHLLEAAANVTKLALGYGSDESDGVVACLGTFDEGPGGIPGDGPGRDSWGYQSCTETLHEFSSRGIRNYTFDLDTSANVPCASLFGTTETKGVPPLPSLSSSSATRLNTSATAARISDSGSDGLGDGLGDSSSSGSVQPDPGALTRRFGGYKLGDGLAGVTNLIWSNGLLDPWHGGGFLTPPPTLKGLASGVSWEKEGGEEGTAADIASVGGNHWVLMPSGAHHLDLRGPDPQDPEDVIAARQYEEVVIRGWIDEYALKSAALVLK